MASNKQVVNLNQPDAEYIIMGWLNDEDMNPDDESQQSQNVPRPFIPEELLSDSEDECQETKVNTVTLCPKRLKRKMFGVYEEDLRPFCCDSQILSAAHFSF